MQLSFLATLPPTSFPLFALATAERSIVSTVTRKLVPVDLPPCAALAGCCVSIRGVYPSRNTSQTTACAQRFPGRNVTPKRQSQMLPARARQIQILSLSTNAHWQTKQENSRRTKAQLATYDCVKGVRVSMGGGGGGLRENATPAQGFLFR